MSFVAAIISGGIAAAGGITSSILGSKAAGKAADAQVSGANYAADLNKKAADEALAFNREQFNKGQENLAPWLQAGKTSLAQLSTDMAPGGQLTKGFDEVFQNPDLNETTDPGYAARLAEGNKSLQRAQSARGGGLGGAAVKQGIRYGQDYASNEYSNVWGRAKSAYDTRFNVFNVNQANRFNRLASIAGIGQTTANQMNQSGQAAASNAGNIVLGSAAAQGDYATQAANARASGYVGSANAVNSGISSAVNPFLQQMMLKQIYGGSAAAAPTNPEYFGPALVG
jgi:hypothetical protein